MLFFLEEVSDDFLIKLYFDKNQEAIDFLFERYTVFIYGIIAGLQKKYGDYIEFDELFQEGFLQFMKCIDRYDDESGCFYFFTKKSIERKLTDVINCANKYKRLNSLDSRRFNSGSESNLDYINEESDYSYYDNCLYERLVLRLDAKNKDIVDLKMMGYSYSEIACILGSNKQDVYRRVSKIKNILKDIIEKID